MKIIIILMVIFMELIQVVYKTIFFYFLIILAFRIMGKREVGQLGIIDLIVTILIAELTAISIENPSNSIFLAIFPIVTLVILEIILSYISLKSRTFRNIFGGKPSLIISNGKVNYHEMIKLRYSLDDLLISLRQKEIRNIDEVEYAFLEPNGKLSIFKYGIFKIKKAYPMPLIVDGQVQEKALLYIKKDKDWLMNQIIEKNLNLENIFYAFYKNNKIYVIKTTNLK